MKASTFKSNLIVTTLTLLFLLGPGTGKAQGDVKIRGENLPPDVLQMVDSHLQDPNKDVDGIQFRDLNAERALDCGRDWEQKIHSRIEREKHERFGGGNNRGRGSDRIGALRERAERFVREKVDR